MLNKKDTKICLKAEQIKRHGSVSQYFPKPKSLEANEEKKQEYNLIILLQLKRETNFTTKIVNGYIVYDLDYCPKIPLRNFT